MDIRDCTRVSNRESFHEAVGVILDHQEEFHRSLSYSVVRVEGDPITFWIKDGTRTMGIILTRFHYEVFIPDTVLHRHVNAIDCNITDDL